MKPFKTSQKLSCILMGMGMVVSAHAIPVSDCDENLSINGETYDLQNDIQCSAGQQIEITGGDITFNLNGFNIEQAGSLTQAIEISSDGNQVNGPGEIIGFPFGVSIINANNNRVRKLDINGDNLSGGTGVSLSSFAGLTANGNHISNNMIRNLTITGIALTGFTGDGEINGNVLHDNDIINITGGGSAHGIFIRTGSLDTVEVNNNFIHHNNIEKITGTGGIVDAVGIRLLNEGGGIMNNNRVESNRIKDVSTTGFVSDGIRLESNTASSVDLNTVFANEISDVGRYGITLDSAVATSTTNQNIIFKNHITNTGNSAIALDPGAAMGSVALNSITFNLTDNSTTRRYCDTSGEFNNWGINSRGLLLPPLFGTPVACP